MTDYYRTTAAYANRGAKLVVQQERTNGGKRINEYLVIEQGPHDRGHVIYRNTDIEMVRVYVRALSRPVTWEV